MGYIDVWGHRPNFSELSKLWLSTYLNIAFIFDGCRRSLAVGGDTWQRGGINRYFFHGDINEWRFSIISWRHHESEAEALRKIWLLLLDNLHRDASINHIMPDIIKP